MPASPATRLVLDRRWIDRTQGLTLTLAPCERHPQNPLPLDGERIWAFGNLTAAIYRDGAAGTYRGWYPRRVVRGDEQSRFEPVESEDGIAWRSAGAAYGEGGARTILYDARDPDPARRFKSIQQEFARPEPGGGETRVPTAEGRRMHVAGEPLLRRMVAYTSPDGRAWSAPHAIVKSLPGPTHPWWVPGEPGWEGGDNFPSLIWAPELEKYVAFFRTNVYNGEGQRRERALGRADSADFERWGEHSVALLSRVPWHAALGYERHDFYQMQIWRCAGVYLGAVSVFYWDQDRVHLELAWSPDTLHWERICPGQDLIPHGALGQFDGGCRYAAMRPIEVDDQVRVYYGGSYGRHNADKTGDSALCLATFRRDRFAGYHAAGSAAGVLLTRPFELGKGHLTLNVDASRGEVRAELCDEAGAPLPGFSHDDAAPINADGLEIPVTWTAERQSDRDAVDPSAHLVRLRLYVSGATAYAVTAS